MAIPLRYCTNHPQRPAIGVCVMTHKPICGECSTRYEGVNYSREGLEMLRQQRAAARRPRGKVGLLAISWALSPALLYLMYLGFVLMADALMSLLHGEL